MEGSGKVLVVDDELGIRILLSDYLSSKGFDVSMAKDGQESLDQLKANIFDVVITDINMPRLDGIEMLKSMKKAGRKEKVIVMTGNPSDCRLTDMETPQVVTRLIKPFNIDYLLDVIVVATADLRNMPGTENLKCTTR